MRTTLAMIVMGMLPAAALAAPLPPYNGQPIPSKIDPSKLPPANTLKPNFPKITTEIIGGFQDFSGNALQSDANGNLTRAAGAVFVASVSTDPALGSSAATALTVKQSNLVTCSNGTSDIPKGYDTPVKGTPSGKTLTATIKITADRFMTAGLCMGKGGPMVGYTTLDVSVTIALGLTLSKQYVLTAPALNQ
jgi:hypothetical protein